VLFGGCCPSAETWTWDGASWSRRLPSDAPSPRSSHTMAYDVARRVTVLFGGTATFLEAFDDTWVLAGRTWQQLA
jgi:hypothetical protein